MKNINNTSGCDRRTFVKKATLSAMAVPYIIPSAVWSKGKTAPSDKINLGIIGCGGLGKANLDACMQDEGVELVAACARKRRGGDAGALGGTRAGRLGRRL